MVLVTTSCILPLTYLSLVAKIGDAVSLQWATSSENNSGFEIEHCPNGRSWNKIAFVDRSLPLTGNR